MVTFNDKGVLVKVNGPSVVLIETHGARHNCMEIDHQHGSIRKPLYDRTYLGMDNTSLVERDFLIFATSSKSFSTRKYKKTHLHSIYQNLNTTTIDNLLHRINPSDQRNTHQNRQGMTENYQENNALGCPWVLGKLL
jgi:hypothetical protein